MISNAGFWRRFLAIVIDALIVFPFFYGFQIYGAGAAVSVVYLTYFVLMEGSSQRGTLGKMAMQIQVTDEEGNQISYTRSLMRNLLKSISAIFLFGFIMAAFTKKKQAFHDIPTKCVVLNKP